MPSNHPLLPSESATWRRLATLARDSAASMTRDDGTRLGSQPPLSACGIEIDDSRRVLTAEAIDLLLALADERQLAKRRDALLAGAVVNRSEGRAALHPLLRDFGGPVCGKAPEAARQSVQRTRARMRAMAEQLHTGALRGSTGARITDIVNIGIGGSEFGARLLCDALQDLAPAGLRVHFVSNLDALQITRLLGKLNAGSTLFVVSSKSFGTVETLLNARTLRRWFDGFGLKMEDHWFAVTGKAAAAEAIGIPAANVLDVPEWVGGRFSPWGAVGLPAALMLGWPVYEQWLRGGAAADEHFATAPARENLPMRLALDNVWHSTFLGCQTHCIAAYDDRLAAFITWAQQLEMESNGKSVSEDRRASRLRHRAGRVGRARQQRAAHVLPAAARRHHAEGRHLDRLPNGVRRIRGSRGRTARPSRRAGRCAEPARVDSRIQLARACWCSTTSTPSTSAR